jgi:hypothetical protein
MTRGPLQIRMEQHAQASASPTAVPAQTGAGPSVSEDGERPQAALPSMLTHPARLSPGLSPLPDGTPTRPHNTRSGTARAATPTTGLSPIAMPLRARARSGAGHRK